MSEQKYVKLNNGVEMPVTGIGTFLLSPDEAEASVLSALQGGYRLIDTANAYVNEKAVGRAMKKSGVPREEIFLELRFGRRSMSRRTQWKKRFKGWIPITLTCF